MKCSFMRASQVEKCIARSPQTKDSSKHQHPSTSPTKPNNWLPRLVDFGVLPADFDFRSRWRCDYNRRWLRHVRCSRNEIRILRCSRRFLKVWMVCGSSRISGELSGMQLHLLASLSQHSSRLVPHNWAID